ncbi:hypothetical protein F0562_035243 [Nyssa sinensis]|uniref:Glycosyltransferase n=1 Tax=Nyssa sinensis TaxID=561372 RepID=A0A5J5ACM9_9ASTE|nr:hypothetical protein F0562_035243 [Nyssa sinensis]
MAMGDRHVLLVVFPGQGQINPSLQFAKRLVKMGVKVTFATSVSAIRRMTKTTPTTELGITFAGFSDGHNEAFKTDDDLEQLMSEFKINGSQAVTDLITTSVKQGQPITHVVYTTILSWVAEVARGLHVPSTLLWIQPTTLLDIYYYYFNGYGDAIEKSVSDPSFSIELPGLPVLTNRDLPSFFLPSNPFNFALPAHKEHFDTLDKETNPQVLINTFDALESEALKAIPKLNLLAVGPLIPSAFLGGEDPSDTSFGGDLFEKSGDYVEWLNSKPKSSVIYVSFGSISVLSKKQMEEIASGLLESKRPFLWVIREEQQNGEKVEDKLSCREELEKQGIIVPWCSQVEVLSHPSLGCFVTHCGWNSSFESLVSGVPMVGFPQWIDQPTNAKLIQDVWKTGVRVTKNEEGIVDSDEVKGCIEIVMGGGEKGEEMRRNAKKWKELAREAVKKGGSSDKNLKAFVTHALK